MIYESISFAYQMELRSLYSVVVFSTASVTIVSDLLPTVRSVGGFGAEDQRSYFSTSCRPWQNDSYMVSPLHVVIACIFCQRATFFL